jgi:hypothetical protein
MFTNLPAKATYFGSLYAIPVGAPVPMTSLSLGVVLRMGLVVWARRRGGQFDPDRSHPACPCPIVQLAYTCAFVRWSVWWMDLGLHDLCLPDAPTCLHGLALSPNSLAYLSPRGLLYFLSMHRSGWPNSPRLGVVSMSQKRPFHHLPRWWVFRIVRQFLRDHHLPACALPNSAVATVDTHGLDWVCTVKNTLFRILLPRHLPGG